MGGESVAAGAMDLDLVILGMDSSFHINLRPAAWYAEAAEEYTTTPLGARDAMHRTTAMKNRR